MTTPEPEARTPLSAIAGELARWIEFEKAEGMRSIEISPDAVARLADPPPARRPSAGRTADRKSGGLDEIAARIAGCTRCPLHRTRTRTVPGQGHPHPDLIFVGEGPGADEDRQGLPFIGRAGQLLTRLIVRMGFTRESVFIANVVKCRPTENYEMQKDRAPTEEEMRTCLPYLEDQIAALRPKVIVCLGGTATLGLLGLKGITRLRGQWHAFRGIPVMPTYHPSYLLRGGGDEKARYWEVWEDMIQILARLGRPAPEIRKPPQT